MHQGETPRLERNIGCLDEKEQRSGTDRRAITRVKALESREKKDCPAGEQRRKPKTMQRPVNGKEGNLLVSKGKSPPEIRE